MVCADHPDRSVVFEHPATFTEPGSGECIILLNILKLIPRIIDAVHNGLIGTEQFVTKPEIVRRIGKNQSTDFFRGMFSRPEYSRPG